MQALLLPVAFATLGWAWGIICWSLAFVWQLYTIWLLTRLHESLHGIRYSRYLHHSIAAFGTKLGKLLAIFPTLYLSGGTCVMLIITGGGTMELLFKTVCDSGSTCHAKSLSGAEWFLVFTCIAILIAQLPNLNSMAPVSLIGAITAILYSALIWVLSITKGRPAGGVSYSPSETVTMNSNLMGKISSILNALGICSCLQRSQCHTRDTGNIAFESKTSIPQAYVQRSDNILYTNRHEPIPPRNRWILGLWKQDTL
ncbi:hypothetical protein I3843_06G112200 [Carya illinoinensis]|nr:hypothetical protein I3843_06G112200 [Carya illinoinensis]